MKSLDRTNSKGTTFSQKKCFMYICFSTLVLKIHEVVSWAIKWGILMIAYLKDQGSMYVLVYACVPFSVHHCVC